MGVLYKRYGRSDGNLYIVYSDQDLVTSDATFIRIMQVVTVILLAVYAYLYFFGVEEVKKLLGFESNDFS